MQRLNGEQALRYSRIRYVGNGDYERTERHRTILNSVFTKLMKQDKTKILSTVSEILPMVKTNLSNNQIMDLTMDVIDIKPSKIEQTRFPADGFCQGKMINGIYYLTFDQEATNEQLYKFIFE
jgi:anionic cell wall polymer biosynthesis LytR-Cps2A-Psr (LCP) family protein